MTNQDRQSTAFPQAGIGRAPATPGQPRGGSSRRAVGRRPLFGCLSASPCTASAADPARRHCLRHPRRRAGVGLSRACGGGSTSGPIQLDVFTPWLVSAIEENFGSRERVEVGGTQFERTENGGAAVRVRDIVVRDPDGTVVARAPKAEIRVSGMSLFSGRMRAESLNLVGAAMAVRIERTAMSPSSPGAR